MPEIAVPAGDATPVAAAKRAPIFDRLQFYLPTTVVGAFAAFSALTVLIHIVPNWGVPLHSDTTWIFRLMAADPATGLSSAIPQAYRELGALPQNPIAAFPAWYDSTGRFNILDLVTSWFIGRFAGDQADIWRIVFALCMSMSVALLYSTSVALKVPRTLAFLMAVGLLFSPTELWIRHNTSEPKALVFAMAAVYFAARHRVNWASAATAACLIIAVLIKETFVVVWPLVAGLIAIRIRGNNQLNYVRPLIRAALPHVVAVLLVAGFVWFLKANYTVASSYVSSGNFGGVRFIASFAFTYARELLTLIAGPIGVAALMFLSWGLFAQRDAVMRAVREFKQRDVILLLSLCLVTLFLHAMVYYATGRLISSRYVAPGNFVFALLVALIVAPFARALALRLSDAGVKITTFAAIAYLVWPLSVSRQAMLASFVTTFVMIVLGLFVLALQALVRGRATAVWRQRMIVALLALAIIPRTPAALDAAARNAIDQAAWDSLIRRTAAAPANTHVMLEFAEPYMIETAQALEANTLLMGRRDLVYHLAIRDTSRLQANSDVARLVKIQIDAFNANRTSPAANAAVLRIKADRNGGAPVAAEGIATALRSGSPPRLLAAMLGGERRPYLNYSIQ